MTVQSGSDVNGNGDSAGDRAVFNPTGVPGTSSNVSTLFSTNTCASLATALQAACFSSHTVAYLATTPTAQYIRGGAFAQLNAGRNTIPARHINNLDLTALKRFSLTEQMKFEFSVQALNVLNHPQFVPGSLNDVASIGYTGSRSFLQPGNAQFNDPEAVFASNARALQLALKFVF